MVFYSDSTDIISLNEFWFALLGIIFQKNYSAEYSEESKYLNSLFVSLTDLAPGNDEIYEEKQETFLTAGNPQDGQVVLYKVKPPQFYFVCIFYMARS